MRNLVFCFALIILSPSVFAITELDSGAEATVLATTPKIAVVTNNQKPEPVVYAANYAETHYIGKCDSDAVKKRAHKWGFMSYQKQQDVAMQTRCFNTCDILATADPTQAVSCIRECNDQQREQRQQGFTAGQGIVNLLGIGAALLK